MMKMKHLVVGIGLCACTYFVSETAEQRKITFKNESCHNFTLYHTDHVGLNAHATLIGKDYAYLPIRSSNENIVVKWNEANTQHKIFINRQQSNTVKIFQAVVLRNAGQADTFFFPDPDKQKPQSSSSSSEDEDQ